MTAEQNKEIVRRHFESISKGDAKGAASLYSLITRNHGREINRETMAMVIGSLVALEERYVLHEIVAEGDWVACRVTVSGKHNAKPAVPIDSGIYSLTQPTGRPFSFQHMHLFRILNGQIVEHWANRDDLGAARQLGLELGPTR